MIGRSPRLLYALSLCFLAVSAQVASAAPELFAEFQSSVGEAGIQEVRLFINGEDVTDGASLSEKRVSHPVGDLPAGEHRARVVVVDALGRSQAKEWTFEVGAESPEELVAFFTPDLFVEFDRLPSRTTDESLLVSGTTQPFVDVELRVEGRLAARVVSTGSGRFSALLELNEGSNQLVAEASRPLTQELGREARARVELRPLSREQIKEPPVVSVKEPGLDTTGTVGTRGTPELIDGESPPRHAPEWPTLREPDGTLRPTHVRSIGDREEPRGSDRPVIVDESPLPRLDDLGESPREGAELRRVPDQQEPRGLDRPGIGEESPLPRLDGLGMALREDEELRRVPDQREPRGPGPVPIEEEPPSWPRLEDPGTTVREPEAPGPVDSGPTSRRGGGGEAGQPHARLGQRSVGHVRHRPQRQGLDIQAPARRSTTSRRDSYQVEGRAFEHARIEVEVNGRLVADGVADSAGVFRVDVPLEAGTNHVIVEAFGESGESARSGVFSIQQRASARTSRRPMDRRIRALDGERRRVRVETRGRELKEPARTIRSPG